MVLKIKKGASTSSVHDAMKSAKFKVFTTKPKAKKAERPKKQRKQKVKKETKPETKEKKIENKLMGRYIKSPKSYFKQSESRV